MKYLESNKIMNYLQVILIFTDNSIYALIFFQKKV